MWKKFEEEKPEMGIVVLTCYKRAYDPCMVELSVFNRPADRKSGKYVYEYYLVASCESVEYCRDGSENVKFTNEDKCQEFEHTRMFWMPIPPGEFK